MVAMDTSCLVNEKYTMTKGATIGDKKSYHSGVEKSLDSRSLGKLFMPTLHFSRRVILSFKLRAH